MKLAGQTAVSQLPGLSSAGQLTPSTPPGGLRLLLGPGRRQSASVRAGPHSPQRQAPSEEKGQPQGPQRPPPSQRCLPHLANTFLLCGVCEHTYFQRAFSHPLSSAMAHNLFPVPPKVKQLSKPRPRGDPGLTATVRRRVFQVHGRHLPVSTQAGFPLWGPAGPRHPRRPEASSGFL